MNSRLKTLAIAIVAIILLGAVTASAQGPLAGQQATAVNPEDVSINFSISWHAILVVTSLVIGFAIGWLVRGARVNRNIAGAIILMLLVSPAFASAQDRMVPLNQPGTAASAPEVNPPAPEPPVRPEQQRERVQPEVRPMPIPAPAPTKGILDEDAAMHNGRFYTVREAIGYNLVHGDSMLKRLNWLFVVGGMLMLIGVTSLMRLRELRDELAILRTDVQALRPAQPAAETPVNPAPPANAPGPRGIITALVLTLLIPTLVFAQGRTAKVMSIAPDAWVEGTDKVVTITCSPSCGDVADLEFAAGVTASDVKAAGRNKVSAKLTLGAPGPYTFNLIRKDGSKVASGNVAFTVFTTTEARLVDYLQGKINARQSGNDVQARKQITELQRGLRDLRDTVTTLDAYHQGTQRDVAEIKADYVSRTNLGAEVLNTEVAKTGDGQVVTMRAALEALSNNAKALEGRVGTVETRTGHLETAARATGDVVDALAETTKTGGPFNRKPAVSNDLRTAFLEALKPIPAKPRHANGGGN